MNGPSAPAQGPALAEQFRQAMLLQQQGRSDAAEALCSTILKIDPRHAGALFLAGSIALQRGQVPAAIELLRRSIAADQGQARAHLNLGAALLYLAKPSEALTSFDHALALAPTDALAHNNRATALMELERPADALASLDRAVQLQPNFVGAFCNRGDALAALGQTERALASYAQAVRLKPDSIAALCSEGRTLLALRRPEEALASFERVLQLQPAFEQAHYDRGNALVALERLEEAIESYRRAVQLNPGYTEALNNLASTLVLARKPGEALPVFDQVLKLRPDSVQALSNQGYLLRGLQRHEEAAACFGRLLAIAPDYDYAFGALCHARLMSCDWAQYDPDVARLSAAVNAGKRADSPLSFLAVSDSAEAHLRCAQTYVSQQFPAAPVPLWRGERYRHDRIRIAYLSADFHEHATAYLAAELFERHDRERFESIAISFGPDDGSAMRARLRTAFEKFIDVRELSDRAAAEVIRKLEVDIAIDLKGLTQDCRMRILAQRAAPLQVNYLGYPGTLGAPYIDYILADRQVIPAESQHHYAEKVVYLPDCYQANDRKRAIAPEAPTREQAGLPAEGFVFCCFNNNYKITPPVFDLWMRLLRAIPGSVLWLFEANPGAARNLREAAAGRQVSPERLIFARRLPLAEHLARHCLADLFLDTIPVNAHTTASDALWAGLPVLTCAGEAFAARVAASLLHGVGLPELVTESLAEYERKALQLASEPRLLAELRARLALNRETAALFDTDRLRRHIELAYRTMYERHQAGGPPAGFAVPRIA